MSRVATIFLSLLIISQAGFAQSKKKEEKVDPNAGRVPSGFVGCEVVLENGAVFHGLVKKGETVEVIKRHKYLVVDASRKSDFGAGIRLWFYDGLAGFLFFQYRNIDKVVVKRELSVDEFADVKKSAKERQEKKAAQAKQTKATAKVVNKSNGDRASFLDSESRRLLDRWSPQDGWTEAKFGELQKRAIVEAYQFSKEEAEWSKIYPDWLKALRKSQAMSVGNGSNSPKTPNAKLVSKKKSTSAPKTTKSDVSVSRNGRIRAKLKRAERKSPATSGANRKLR